MTPTTLAEAFDQAVRRWPAKTAVRAGCTSVSYAALNTAVGELAHTFTQLGAGGGERVLCHLPNSVAHVAAMNATWRCGGVHVGAHPDLTPNEVAALAARTRPSVAVIGGAEVPRTVEAVEAASPSTTVLPVEEAAGDTTTPLGRRSPAPPRPEDPAVVFFTSGTTGLPKGVVHNHAKLTGDWLRLATILELDHEDVHLGHLPLAHGFGLGMATLALITGGELVLMERFDPVGALDLMARRRVTVLHGAPTHFRLLLDRLGEHDVSSLRTGVTTAGLFPPALIAEIGDRFRMGLRLVYGCSEGINVGTSDPAVMLSGAVGRPTPGEVQILGPDGRSQPDGQIGHIVFQTDQPVRYWGETDGAGDDPSEAEPPSSASYLSGDLGRLDEDGYLYVVGRAKEQINRGGQKVDPVEVETAVAACPGVAEAAVVGLPDPVLGEVVCACVVPASGAIVRLEALRRALGRSVARYKLPEVLRVVDRVPRTSLGKVDRPALRALVSEGEWR